MIKKSNVSRIFLKGFEINLFSREKKLDKMAPKQAKHRASNWRTNETELSATLVAGEEHQLALSLERIALNRGVGRINQTSKKELFCGSSLRLLAINYFRKKA